MQLSPTKCGRNYASPSPISEDMSTSAGRNSPPSLLIIGNNSLKQLAFGARARGLAAASQFALRAHPTRSLRDRRIHSPAPICRSSNCHNSECSRCARRIMLFLKVVMVVSKSQCAWVKNGDAPAPAGIVGTVPEGTHFRPVSTNHRMKRPQTTERKSEKTPDGNRKNCRTEIRKTAEWILTSVRCM